MTKPPVASTSPVLIVGAGLGGLALAHALKTHNIPFQLFERDHSPAFRAQGYRIRIQDFYLKQLLPPDLWAVFENCYSEPIPGGKMVDAVTGQVLEGGFRPPPGGSEKGNMPMSAISEGNTMNVDRRVLRDLMMEPMVENGSVIFGKKFVDYREVNDGVLARFDDGTEAMGCLLIGADGSRSTVRKQLVPEFELLDTQGRAIFGKTIIDQALTDSISKEIGKGICVVSDSQDHERPVKLFTDSMIFDRRAKASIDLPQDYVYWVLVMRNDKTAMSDEQFMTLPQDEAVAASLEYTQSWHPTCQALLRYQVPDQTSTLAFVTAHPDCAPWQTSGRVTLLGDAAHPLTPVGGVGANAAFQDAVLLAQALVAGAEIDEVGAYEREMLENARRYLKISTGGAGRMFGMRPVDELSGWKLWR